MQKLNLTLGDGRFPFDVDGKTGGEASCGVKRSFPFGFVHQSIPFSAHYEEAGEMARIELVGEIGPLPFSAESAAARANLQMILDAANAQLGRAFRVHDGLIELLGQTTLEVPVTAVGMVTAIARILLPIKPYLACIDLFLAPPCEEREPGESRVRPAWRRHPPRKKSGFSSGSVGHRAG